MVQVLCVALMLMSSLICLVGHHLLIEHERQWGPLWARTQAQALGHGGLMWALARLEDPRSLDEECRATGLGPGGLRFAERAERPGAHMSCAVEAAPGTDAGPLPWSCRCGSSSGGSTAHGVSPAGEASGSQEPGLIEWTFESSGEFLLLVVNARWQSGAAEGRWREQVLLRRDAQSIWRMVVGSWWDDRS